MSAAKPILPVFFIPKNDEEREEKERLYKKYTDLVSTLPKSLFLTMVLRQFKGYWFQEIFLPSTLAAQDHFQAQPSDILIASYPKSGTTWLKALVFSIVRRSKYSPINNPNHPLFIENPHGLIGLLESQVPSDPDPFASPRIFQSHSPFSILPESVKENAKIVYVCRDPKDTIVSVFHFFLVCADQEVSRSLKEGMFTMFCDGKCPWGPIWDHVLEFWNESKRSPHEVLFLKYEELKSDITNNVKRLAEFLGFQFSQDEEKEGVVDGIIKLCSFENLSSLDVNRSGTVTGDVFTFDKSSFFRLGKTGDWRNNITEEMAKKLDDIFLQKLDGSGLSF